MAITIHRAVVADTQTLTPGMIRVVLDVADYPGTGVGDEYVRLFFPSPGRTEPVLPKPSGNSWAYDDGAEPSPMRTYTIRSADPAAGTVAIDFVVHDGGVAAAWARAAKTGDAIGLTSPTGLYDPPPGTAWQLLFTDAPGLPAAARIVEQTRPGLKTRVIAEIGDPSHAYPIPEHPDCELTWVHGGNGHGGSHLDALVRQTPLPEGTGYIWFAGESAAMRSVRKYLRHELGLPGTAYKTVGYWTTKAEALEKAWRELDDDTKRRLREMWDDDTRDEEEITDEYHEQLDRLGL
ncbi:siderophore-interacting protein [Phytomonospora sp. NPDC050363]|uniref:siderophore-interacting protein n=1 Tax=Phytomonospora sp. NPDC050363 TaxID=3155642 RepID=UPI0033EF0093